MQSNQTSTDGYKLIYLLGFIIALTALGYFVKQKGNKQFENNKEQTFAIVQNFIKDRHNSDYLSYERYILAYEYNVGNKKLQNNFEIRIDDVNLYFDEKPKRGDTISITYNSLKPKESKPIKKN